jgi:cell division protein FtsL
MKRRILLYAIALTIPLILGLDSWQASRYAHVDAELRLLETEQREWLESNKRLIAGIAVLGSSERIERIARDELGLRKAAPESVLQIGIERRRGVDG